MAKPKAAPTAQYRAVVELRRSNAATARPGKKAAKLPRAQAKRAWRAEVA